MKKWLFIIGFLIIVFIICSTVIYVNAVDPLKSAEEKAVRIAKQETSLTEVDNFNLYNGEESFSVLQGKDKNGTKLIVWVPEKEGRLVVKKATDGITRQEAIEIVSGELASDTINSVKLGMEKGIPLWEVHTRTSDHLLNYYSLEFESGEWLKKIENL